MNEDYEHIFNLINENPSITIKENLLDFGVDIFTFNKSNQDSDYHINLEEFRTATKAESLERHSPLHMFDVNCNFIT